HLLGNQNEAAEAVRMGLRVAEGKGSLSHVSYLLSTSGEIALAQGDLDAAERFFTEGLAAAQRLPLPERIAGTTANLGLVAKARGQEDLARERLTDALTRADALGNGHLSVRIRIWLAPLLPPEQRKTRLNEARAIAEANGYAGLLEEIRRLET
ncbi:MAG TPA: tetratricopeptide repeat protein, partial [Anaerolineae bacterium]|nr:tetratricopeptide repeat protein [Anaerolineae bacterium]